jgi:hypothetical protein
MHKGQSRKLLLRLVIALCGVGLLVSCQGGRVLSMSGAKSQASIDEQRMWIADELDAAIEVLGIRDGWYVSLNKENRWPEDRERILDRAYLAICGKGDIYTRPSYLRLTLQNDIPGTESFGPAEVLRDHWKAEGSEVSDVLSPTPGPVTEVYFRADRKDGAVLGLDAFEYMVQISADAACSDHETVHQ